MIDNKKLAEGAGWRFNQGRQSELSTWMPPDWDGMCIWIDLPNFIESVDACLKHLVPGRISEITFMYASNCVSCDIEDLEGNFFEGHVNTESIEEAWTKSALALCLAIEKLIDKEDKR